jgi:hypothetical protein
MPTTTIGKQHPKDGSIWTTFEDSEDTLYFYCSATEGDDANDGLSEETPKQTVAATVNLRIGRDGKPDRLLFKRGDEWNDEYIVCSTLKSGRSIDEPLVIGAYGDESLPRPEFWISRGLNETQYPNSFMFDNGNILNKNDFLAVVDIHVYAYKRDPDNPFFNANSSGMTLISGNQHYTWRLVEGCHAEFCSVLQQKNGDNNPQGTFLLRNNVIEKVWHSTGAVTGAYIHSCLNPVFHNNTFKNCGWYEHVGLYGTADCKPPANGQSHSVYIQTNCGNGEFLGNIAIRTIDMQFRSSGVIRDNLVCEGTAGFVMCEPSTIGGGSTLRSGMDVSRCMVLYATDGYHLSDTTGVDHRTDGPTVYSADGGTMVDCVYAHSEANTTNRPTGFALTSPASRLDLPCTGTVATRCKTFNIQNGTSFIISTESNAAGAEYDASCLEDKDGDNEHGWIDPDNGTLEGYAALQLGQPYTREEFYELLLQQRKGNWRDEIAMYSVMPWLLHQYEDQDDWVRCNNAA